MWIIPIIALAAVPFCVWQNNGIVTTRIKYQNKKIPGNFDGFTIVQISDLHNKNFGVKSEKLLKKVKDASPDMIIVTGDLIDRRRYDLASAMTFIKSALKIAPVYFAPGNHEGWSKKYEIIEKSLKDAGVTTLNNEAIKITEGNESITLIGLKDPSFWTSKSQKHIDHKKQTDASQMIKYCDSLPQNTDFRTVLSHRPELFDLYVGYDFDLVFAGHAHGGQFRVPFIGGLYAPKQGVFPKYTSGAYKKGNTTMIVSRGLGNSRFPLRLNNRPEIVVVIFEAEQSNKK